MDPTAEEIARAAMGEVLLGATLLGVDAHAQVVSHRYVLHEPEHSPREQDPAYPLFEAYRRAHVATATCYVAERLGHGAACSGGLELHHAALEFATINGVDPRAFIVDHPDITDAAALAKWAESAENFRWLCVFHHRGHAGAHVAAHADWEAGLYVPGLIS